MKPLTELEDEFGDFLKEGLRGKIDPGDKAVIESFKKTLETTTPETPGDPYFKEKQSKKDDLKWW